MPNCVGYSEAQALILLLENNLSIGEVKYVKSDTAAGIVLSQSENAWYDVPQFTEIDFEISGGPSYSGSGTSIPTEEDRKPVETTPPETEPPVIQISETETEWGTEPPGETTNSGGSILNNGSGMSGSGLFDDDDDEWFDGFIFGED